MNSDSVDEVANVACNLASHRTAAAKIMMIKKEKKRNISCIVFRGKVVGNEL